MTEAGAWTEDELADRGGATALWRNTHHTKVHLEAERVQRLSGPAAGQ